MEYDVIRTTYGAFSPIHADPPYTGGLGSVWGYGLLISDTIRNDAADSGQPAHARTRERHDPGSGDYTNRWAFPPYGESVARVPTSIGGIRLVFDADAEFDWSDYDPTAKCYQSREFWDGRNYCLMYIKRSGSYWLVEFAGYWYSPTVKRRVKSGINQIGVTLKAFSLRYLARYPDGSHHEGRDKALARMEELWPVVRACDYSNPYPGANNTGYVYYNILCNSGDLINMSHDAQLSSSVLFFEDRLTMLPHTHIGTLEAEAYRRAVDSLPHLGMNNIANIAEIISLIQRMLFSGGLTGVGTLSDAWLAYRYSYSTTKADIEELSSLLNRLDNLSANSKVTTRSVVYDGDTVVRCSIELYSKELDQIHDFAHKWGLALTGYNIWDMIPYSFVVDWFLDIGGKLERGESIKLAYQCRKPAWFSIEKRWINEYNCSEIFYHRHFARPNLREAYLYHVVNDPSGVTIVKRAIDALALVR